jgi:hypothetical protein
MAISRGKSRPSLPRADPRGQIIELIDSINADDRTERINSSAVIHPTLRRRSIVATEMAN